MASNAARLGRMTTTIGISGRVTVIPHDFKLPTTPGSIDSRIERVCANKPSLQS
jgi:hypothetical protein